MVLWLYIIIRYTFVKKLYTKEQQLCTGYKLQSYKITFTDIFNYIDRVSCSLFICLLEVERNICAPFNLYTIQWELHQAH